MVCSLFPGSFADHQPAEPRISNGVRLLKYNYVNSDQDWFLTTVIL